MRKKGRELRGAGALRDDAEGSASPQDERSSEDKQPLPSFSPVPRRYRHDGWTPERQKAFIEALADTGCVTRAAGMVNMAQANCYALRRAAGAEGFRRAWDAALDFGLGRLKDIAFERAIEGQLVPVFVAGKLMGFRRKRNDALLMFCLRHYGQDAGGKRTTINYFSTRATAGAAVLRDASSTSSAAPQDERSGLAQSEASTTTVRTVINEKGGPSTGLGSLDGARDDRAAGVLAGFEGVMLDAEAEGAIAAALEACAARARAAEDALEAGGADGLELAADDPGESFVRVEEGAVAYLGELEPATSLLEYVPFVEGEAPWAMTGAEKPAALVAWEEQRAALAAETPALPGGADAHAAPSARGGDK